MKSKGFNAVVALDIKSSTTLFLVIYVICCWANFVMTFGEGLC